jgi:hypothetical protein
MTWRIWRWQRALARATWALTVAERHTYHVLHNAPAAIQQGQGNIQTLRIQYQQVVLRFQQMQQILALLGLGRFAWQFYINSSGQRVRQAVGRSKTNNR